MKKRSLFSLAFLVTLSLGMGSTFVQSLKKAPDATTPALDETFVAAEAWTIDNANHQYIVKAVIPSPDGRFTLIERTMPFLPQNNSIQDESSLFQEQKDKNSLTLYDNNKQKNVWQTRPDVHFFAPQWSPDGKIISYLVRQLIRNDSDVLTPMYSLWMKSVETDAPKLHFDEDGEITSYLWSPDSKNMAYFSKHLKENKIVVEEYNKKETKNSELYVFSIEDIQNNKESSPLKLQEYILPTDEKNPHKIISWASDSLSLALVVQDARDMQRKILNITLSSGKISILQTGKNPFYPSHSPDGKWIAYVADAEESDKTKGGSPVKRRTVFLHDLQGKETRALSKTPNENPALLGWDATGENLIVLEGDKTLNRLYKLPVNGDKPIVINSSDDQFISCVSLNAKGDLIGFSGESLLTEPDYFISSLNDFSPKHLIPGFLRTLSLKSEVIRWKSFDTLEIEGMLLYPAGYEEGKRYPLLVAAHDGPYQAWQQRFVGSYYDSLPFVPAVFAAKGYAVLMPNVRGSSNYGLAFAQANQKDLGGGDYKDLMAGVDHLVAKGLADPEKLTLWGWGYGGYLAAWATAQTNRFKTAIVGAGITDLISFSGTSDQPDFLDGYLGGPFWTNKDLWLSRSPIMHVEKMNTPLMLQYGAKDKMFPFSQGKELVYAFGKRKIPLKFLIFDQEGHSFDAFGLSRADGLHVAEEWLDQHINPEPQIRSQ